MSLALDELHCRAGAATLASPATSTSSEPNGPTGNKGPSSEPVFRAQPVQSNLYATINMREPEWPGKLASETSSLLAAKLRRWILSSSFMLLAGRLAGRSAPTAIVSGGSNEAFEEWESSLGILLSRLRMCASCALCSAASELLTWLLGAHQARLRTWRAATKSHGCINIQTNSLGCISYDSSETTLAPKRQLESIWLQCSSSCNLFARAWLADRCPMHFRPARAQAEPARPADS